MSNRLGGLCNTLVDNAFGHLASQIFSTLADHGRQTLPGLYQLTEAPLRQVKTALSILVQHHLVLYFRKTTGDEDDDEREPTFYTVDWCAAYCLLRSSKILKLVTDREGETASRMLGNVLQLGHASIGDLAAEYDSAAQPKRDSGIDHDDDDDANDFCKVGEEKNNEHKGIATSELHSLIRTLLKNGYLVKVGPRTYLPKQDLEDQIVRTVMDRDFPTGKVSAKARPGFNSAVNSLKRKHQNEDSYRSQRDDASHGTIKRDESPPPSNKRVKLNGSGPNGVRHRSEVMLEAEKAAGPKLPDDLIVRVNYEKCTTLLRSARLQRMATEYLGPVAGAVYGAMLHCIQDSAKYINPRHVKPTAPDDSDEEDDYAAFSVADMQVLEHLDASVDLEGTVKKHNPSKLPNGDANHRKRPQVLSEDPDEAELGIKREAPSDDDEDKDSTPGLALLKARNKRLAALSSHLNILAEHPKRFIVRAEGENRSRLNVTAVIDRLVEAELDTMIQARFGKHGMRVVRLLREKGKLDDKTIQSFVMLELKYLNKQLLKMQLAGVLNLQEVPKDNARQPPRTLYLWSFDEEKTRSVFLQQTYHTMECLLQRVKVERQGRFKAVIQKAEAMGKGKEETALGSAERDMLKQWREIEEKMLVQVSRCDDVVAVLRDFGADDGGLSL